MTAALLGIQGAELRRVLAAEDLIRAQDSINLLTRPHVAAQFPVRTDDVQRVKDAIAGYERATLVVDIYRNGVPRVR